MVWRGLRLIIGEEVQKGAPAVKHDILLHKSNPRRCLNMYHTLDVRETSLISERTNSV